MQPLKRILKKAFHRKKPRKGAGKPPGGRPSLRLRPTEVRTMNVPAHKGEFALLAKGRGKGGSGSSSGATASYTCGRKSCGEKSTGGAMVSFDSNGVKIFIKIACPRCWTAFAKCWQDHTHSLTSVFYPPRRLRTQCALHTPSETECFPKNTSGVQKQLKTLYFLEKPTAAKSSEKTPNWRNPFC